VALCRHRGFGILDVDVPSVHLELAVLLGEERNKHAREAILLADRGRDRGW
jgi:hypothetical protein